MYNHHTATIPFPFPGINSPCENPRAEHNWLPERFFPVSGTLPVSVPIVNKDEKLLQRMVAIVESNLNDETFDVGQFAAKIGLCRRQLHRKLRVLVNQSPSAFIRTLRLRRAAALIRHSNETLSEIAYKTGFNTPNYFCKVFRREFHCTPKEYRANINSPGVKKVKRVEEIHKTESISTP